MRDLFGEARLIDRGHRIPATDHAERAAARDLGGNRHGAALERLGLEDAEWPVPEDRLGMRDLVAETADRGRSDVDTLPTGLDRRARRRAARRSRVDLPSDHVVGGQQDLHPAPFGFGEDLLLDADLVLGEITVADLDAARREEGVRHGAADQQRIAAGQEVADHADLVGHLRATEHDDEWPRRRVQQRRKRLDLLFHERSDRLLLDEACDSGRRGMRAVRGAECVVDVHVAQGGELASEIGNVAFFLLVKA